jgi:hypothetical protein
LLARFPPKAVRIVRSLTIAAFLGLALGYTTFHWVFPNVSWPAAGEPSFLFIGVILWMASVLAGLLSEDLPSAVAQAMAAVPLGVLISFAIAVSPAMTGFLTVRMDDIIGFILHFGLLVYLIAIPLFLVASLVGVLFRERFALRSAAYRRGNAAPHRK